jgi:hypothetical protein
MVMVALLAALSLSAGQGATTTAPSLSMETVADYLHAVIEADRTFYTTHVIERLQKKGVIAASERWRISDTLPLPAQFLRESSELAERTGAAIRYRLISRWPINPQNGPKTDFERQALEWAERHPEAAVRSINKDGDVQVFDSLYADRAVTQACVGCHNAHPNSAKHDFKVGDVMGGLIISIPLAAPEP